MSAALRARAPDGIGYDALIFDWPREATASPDMLVLWERDFGVLPEPIDEIIVRCRTYVIAAVPQLVVVEAYARIARAARARRQRLAIGSNASTNAVVAGLAATGLAAVFDTVVIWSDVLAGRDKPAAGMTAYDVRTGQLLSHQPPVPDV